jgi:hypothetical protein
MLNVSPSMSGATGHIECACRSLASHAGGLFMGKLAASRTMGKAHINWATVGFCGYFGVHATWCSGYSFNDLPIRVLSHRVRLFFRNVGWINKVGAFDALFATKTKNRLVPCGLFHKYSAQHLSGAFRICTRMLVYPVENLFSPSQAISSSWQKNMWEEGTGSGD